MNHPTVICLILSLLFMSMAIVPAPGSNTIEVGALTPQEIQLRDQLWAELQADGLATTDKAVMIEFEYHDLFINEEIPAYTQMQKYQLLLGSFGVPYGPQRQIHLSTKGGLLIGDFDGSGKMLGAPLRLGLAVASN